MIDVSIWVVVLVVYLVGFVVCARRVYDWEVKEFTHLQGTFDPGMGFTMLVAGLLWPLLALLKGFAWLVTIGKR